MPKHTVFNIFFTIEVCAFAVGFAKCVAFAKPLQWHDQGHYREARLNQPLGQDPGLSLLPAEVTGVAFTNRLARARMVNANLLNGSGVAAGDVDGDGLCDLYLCSLDGENGLFKNLGDWRFKNITASAGVGSAGMSSTGAAFGDLDGDGDLDLFVTSCGGPNALYINDGTGRFMDRTQAAGVEALRIGSTSVAFGDLDGDGDLDIYVANYGETSVLRSGGSLSVRTINGKPVVTGRYANRIRIIDGDMVEVGEPDFLYINDGSGNFTKVNWTSGDWLDENGQPIRKEFWDLGLSVMIRDANQDGRPDIYVCNDFQTPDRFWINQGGGRFRLINELALRHRSYFAMAVDFADINRDGYDDFFVADMMSPTHLLEMTQVDVSNPFAKPIDEFIDRPIIHRNTLFVNRGDNTYMETANFSGVAATEWTWGAAFLDVDLDGFEDLLIANGHAFDTQDLDTIERTSRLGKLPNAQEQKKIFLYPPLVVPNMIFRNKNGLGFTEVGRRWGFDSKNVSHGISLCDLDNDGDQDVVVNCLNAPPLLYRNNATAPRVSVALRGAGGNTRGVGARITIRGGEHVQSQEIIAGGRYLAGDQPQRSFASGRSQSLSIEVDWAGGSRTVVALVKPNHAYEIHQKNTQPKPMLLAKPKPMFIDVSDRLEHVHTERPSDDFVRQPMLPRRLTESGPGVAFVDWDYDGREELFFGDGAGGKLAGYSIDADGRLVKLDDPALDWPLVGDALGFGADAQSMLVALSAHDSPTPTAPSLLRFKPGMAKPEIIELPSDNHSDAGSIAVADVDSDGELDVFVSGRGVPGKFPQPASSWLMRGGPNGLKLDAEQSVVFANLGLVTAAVLVNLDDDPLPELVLATEWGPIRIFSNRGGKFSDVTKAWGLEAQPGLWRTLAVGDFDNDGRFDLIAGNWGLNSHYKHGEKRVPYLVYGDIGGDGFYDALEARFDVAAQRLLPRHRLVTLEQLFPFLRERFSTHRHYAAATVQQLFAGQLVGAKLLKASHLASVVLLNRGGRFETKPLPFEAQLTPISGAAVADFNGDGNEDLFLSQNYFALRVEDYRMDAGEGLLLLGEGGGRFSSIFGHRSGIRVHGEQRGCAVGDLNNDGRPDVLMTQSKGRPKLYLNATGQVGLRVLADQGTMLRPVYDDGSKGPARLVSGGTGRYSRNSRTQLLGAAKRIRSLEVTRPNGTRRNVKTTDLSRLHELSTN
jgi:hypothetical protein